jgi:heme oxygenase
VVLVFNKDIEIALFAAEHNQNFKQLNNKFRCDLVLDHLMHLGMNREVVSSLHQQWSKALDFCDVGNVVLLFTV